MTRRAFHLEWSDPRLERREMLSAVDLRPGPVQVAGHPSHGRDLFHHDGIDGLVLHRTFVNQLNDRLATSRSQADLVTQAFKAFAADFARLRVAPPPGASGPTLADLLARLTDQVDFALARRVLRTNQLTPSASRAPRFSPLARRALIPFANAQIDAMGATLAALPPVAGPGGTPVQGDPTAAINTAVNAILNAVAETTVHPNLFLSPSDFYLSPDVQFTVDFSGAPASAAPGFFVRGPHGVLLPGATLHPHIPI